MLTAQFDKTNATRNLLFFLATLAVFYTIYLAKTILLPVVIATFISLFSSPLVRWLEHRRIPRTIGSCLIISTIFGAAFFLFISLTQPAQLWWKEIPAVMGDMSTSVEAMTKPLSDMGATAEDIQQAAEEDKEVKDNIKYQLVMAAYQSFASATPIVITQILATIFMVYFFLTYGDVLLLRIIEAQKSFGDKRQSVELISLIQAKLSRYVLSITVVNAGLGLCVGIAFYFLGVEDAFLWGALAGILNFAPYLGPLVAAAIFAMVAYIQFDLFSYALLVTGVYLSINLMESQFVTPTVLGNTLNLNPLIVFLWLILWGWMWGGFGMLVGVPLLVCVSIYLEHTQLIGHWSRLLEHQRV